MNSVSVLEKKDKATDLQSNRIWEMSFLISEFRRVFPKPGLLPLEKAEIRRATLRCRKSSWFDLGFWPWRPQKLKAELSGPGPATWGKTRRARSTQQPGLPPLLRLARVHQLLPGFPCEPGVMKTCRHVLDAVLDQGRLRIVIKKQAIQLCCSIETSMILWFYDKWSMSALFNMVTMRKKTKTNTWKKCSYRQTMEQNLKSWF